MKKYCWIIFIFVLAACEQYFVPEVEHHQGILVFDGCITNQLDYPYVKISKSNAYSIDTLLEYVVGFNVQIEDDQGLSIPLREQANGLYKGLDRIKGTIGRTYRLKAISPDGKIYYSKWEPMLAGAPIDALHGKFGTRKVLTYSEGPGYIEKEATGIEVYNSTNAMGFTPFYRYEYDLIIQNTQHYHTLQLPPTYYIAIPASSQTHGFIATSNANLYSNQYISHNLVEFIDSERLNRKVTLGWTVGEDGNSYYTHDDFSLNNFGVLIRINQYSLSEEGFKFWDAISIQGNTTGQIFDAVNNQITGNMYCEQNSDEIIFGYFGASTITSDTIFMKIVLPNELVVKPVIYFPELNKLIYQDIQFDFWVN